MKYFRQITIGLIAITTLPFVLLFSRVDWGLYAIDANLFWSQLALTTASVLGFIGLVLCFWEVLLSLRFLTKYVTQDLLWLNRIHQIIGIYGGAFVLLHPLLETYAYGESLLFNILPSWASDSDLHITFGRIAFIAFCVLWVTSAVIRGKIRYRPWLYLHYLSYVVIVFSLWHIRTIGSVLLEHEWLRTGFLWLLPTTLTLLIARLAYALGFFQQKYKVIAAKKNAHTLLFEVVPLGKHIVPDAGQFCTLQLSVFGESHPFSVMDYDPKTGALTFGVKAFGSFSEKITNLKINDTLWIDGPFGVFTKEGHTPAPKVLIAGGIGITPLYFLAHQYGNEQTYMFNCNPTLADVVGRPSLQYILGNRYTDVLSQDAQQSPAIVCGRLNEEILRERVPQAVWQNAEVFFCGSPGFYSAIKTLLLQMGIPESRIHFEAFSL